MEKLLSKADIKEYLLEVYDNDPRINDALLFTGKRMTLECMSLLGSGSEVSAKCYHFVITRRFKGHEYGYGVRNFTDERMDDIRETMNPLINHLRTKIESMISDDECYLITDVLPGERERGQINGNTDIAWKTNELTIALDVYLFSKAGVASEMLESNASKCMLVLEVESE